MARIELTNKPIAITGASSGIGRATALLCAQAGMPVLLSARRRDKLDAVRAEIEAAGGRAEVLVDDVASEGAGERLARACSDAFGSVYAVFANAGYGFEAPVFGATDDETDRLEAHARAMFETNFWASVATLRGALPFMRQAGAGHMLLCSSCLSKLGLPYYSVYCASKAAQDHYGRALRHELRSERIAVSTVHPVGTRTEFFDRAKEKSAGTTLFERTPNAMLQPPSAVGRAVVRRLRSGRGGEVWTGFTRRLPFAAAVLLPGMTDAVLRKMVAKRRA